jgi:hypothetical protein
MDMKPRFAGDINSNRVGIWQILRFGGILGDDGKRGTRVKAQDPAGQDAGDLLASLVGGQSVGFVVLVHG